MNTDNRITVTDINIPFGRLIVIFIIWGLAAVPAALILGIIFSLISVVFTGFLGGIMGFTSHM